MTSTRVKYLDHEDLIDLDGAGKMVFVDRKTIANWLSQKKLTRYKVANGRTLVSKKELLALIKKVS